MTASATEARPIVTSERKAHTPKAWAFCFLQISRLLCDGYGSQRDWFVKWIL